MLLLQLLFHQQKYTILSSKDYVRDRTRIWSFRCFLLQFIFDPAFVHEKIFYHAHGRLAKTSAQTGVLYDNDKVGVKIELAPCRTEKSICWNLADVQIVNRNLRNGCECHKIQGNLSVLLCERIGLRTQGQLQSLNVIFSFYDIVATTTTRLVAAKIFGKSDCSSSFATIANAPKRISSPLSVDCSIVFLFYFGEVNILGPKRIFLADTIAEAHLYECIRDFLVFYLYRT